MLREFHVLPSEARAKEMKDRDFLWCLVHSLLDREEELEGLCPACRREQEENRCPVCGQVPGEEGVNASFDESRFQQRRGEVSGD